MIPLADQLLEVSHRFGGDEEYSRAGGGNASVKADGVLHIKPSGVPLATLAEGDLVPLRLATLLEALTSDEPVEGDPVRVAAARAQLSDAGGRRPSVEILFHALFPEALVLHTHPLVANALTCNTDAEALAARLLGDRAVYVPYIDPGVPLARGVEAARAAFVQRTGTPAPPITLLGNHGLIVAGDSAAEVIERTEWVTGVIRAAIEAVPAPAIPVADEAVARTVITQLAPALRGLLGSADALAVVTSDAGQLVRQVTPTASGEALATGGPLIPDQIVYAGSLPLVLDAAALADSTSATATVREALAGYRAAHGRDPKITVVPGVVALGAGADLATARTALATYTDALRVARDADRIGTVRTMDAAERGFIENWEAESYRQSMAATQVAGRLAGKVALVTGAAQGFGLGIAEELLGAGAHVLLADLNIDLASKNAADLEARHGAGRAVALPMNVADEASALDAVAAAVAITGGIDVFVSNAGVLRAEGVMTQPVADFDLVTAVNYRGYFLGVRAVAPIMARQHEARPEAWFDIIEINSKSGLEGSKRNFAYAGSKFGGIGLTQSFALELVEYGIKVNAVCPGNFLDGPLWSDPERGLFVQYLRAGKVPGATAVADVRHHYESLVPMRRGCVPADLAKAIYYIVDQSYETGQAVPVTGGQIMLS